MGFFQKASYHINLDTNQELTAEVSRLKTKMESLHATLNSTQSEQTSSFQNFNQSTFFVTSCISMLCGAFDRRGGEISFRTTLHKMTPAATHMADAACDSIHASTSPLM